MRAMDKAVSDVVRAEWCALLEIDHAREEDEFFALGGNSMLALALIGRVEEQLGIRFPLEALFVDDTFGAVVEACAAVYKEKDANPIGL